MFDRFRELWSDRPTPVKDRVQSMAIRGLAVAVVVVFAASFLGSLLATKGCE